jgi:hypothetical protein
LTARFTTGIDVLIHDRQHRIVHFQDGRETRLLRMLAGPTLVL